MTRIPFLLLILIQPLLGGCLNDSNQGESLTQFLVPANGQATYRIESDKEPSGAWISVSYEIVEDRIVLHASVSPPVTNRYFVPPASSEMAVNWSVPEAEFQDLDSGGNRVGLIGSDKLIPSPRVPITPEQDSGLTSFQSWDAFSVLPWGPNMLRLATSLVNRSGLILEFESHAGAWLASGSLQCPHQCASDKEPIPWTLRMIGRNASPFVDEVHWSGRFYLNLTLQSEELSRDRVRLDVTLSEIPSLPLEDPCGFVPCNPEAWPNHLSLETGMSALIATSEWKEWAGDSEVIPVALATAPFSAGTMPATTSVHWVDWVLEFTKPETKVLHMFILRGINVPGTSNYGPPVLIQEIERENLIGHSAGQAIPAGTNLLEILETARNTIGATGTPKAISVYNSPLRWTPSEDHRITVRFSWGEEGQSYSSYKTGEYWYSFDP